MECEYPSTNDIIATPVGGMALGEVFFRASDLILDDRKTGSERIGREVAAFLISPMRGLTRLINGDYKRKRRTSGRQFGIPDISIDVSAGIRSMELRDEYDTGTSATATVSIEYGDRFDAESVIPYDYFSMRANLNFQEFQPVLGQINIIGRLYSFELKDSKSEFASLGFYQHFDYYDTEYLSWISLKTPYKFCTPASIGVGLVYRSKKTAKIDWDFYAHLNGILLGASLSDYYFVDDRDYNLASGFSNKLGVNFIYKKDVASASVFHEGFYMYTWKGYPQNIDWNNFDRRTLNAQGDKSRAFLHALSLRLDGKIWRQIYLTAIGSIYLRSTNYKYYDNVFSRTREARLMLTYKF